MKEQGRKKTGLALSGAVLRGVAHLGVLHTLEQAGVPIDVVSGTSAGALVGALYCAGLSPAEMYAQLDDLGWPSLAAPEWPPRKGFVSFAKLERWLESLIGDVTFEELSKPLVVVATDLKTGRPVTLTQGSVAHAVRASCSVPGFVSPLEQEGMVLCDGGISCNLPVRPAREVGAEYVIGVDLFQPHLRTSWGPFGYGFAAIETMVQATGGGLEEADCLIAVEMAGHSYVGFGHAKEFLGLAALATEAKLPEIRAALGLPAANPV